VAQELDPVSLNINASVGALFYFTRHYNQAIKQLLATLELDPHFAYADFLLGLVYEAKGEYDVALDQYQKAQSDLGESPELAAHVARVDALSGKRDKAQKVVDQLKELSERGYELRYYIALIYVGLGDSDRAFGWLEQACDAREQDLGLLRIDPMLDGLREDLRFMSLLGRVGLI
jgi:tetratricopeptide (TPR) repeat protein